VTALTETSTRRASPLAEWGTRLAAVSDRPAEFSIHELPFASQVNLRGDPADPAFSGAVRGVLGCDLPLAANTWVAGNDTSVLWLGPDEWLVVAPDGRSDTLCAGLRAALQGLHHSVTDISANRTILEVSGEYARLVLAKGCPLDLHAGAFAPPQCAQTLLAKAQMILQCVEARPVFRVFVRISFAPYVAEWLIDAATELAASRDIDTGRIARSLN
jgi:sarcosine oxidase subunit gamma